jgi:serine/threonine protein kinase
MVFIPRLLCLVMEYCHYGDISQYYASPLAEIETRDISVQLLEALGVLHNLAITHRDIKPQVSITACSITRQLLKSGRVYRTYLSYRSLLSKSSLQILGSAN